MGFKDFRRIVDGNRNYRAICLRCNLKASLMEGEHFQLAVMFVSGPFRKDTDGHTVFDLIYSSENGFQSFFDILSVQKKAVEIFHPVGQQRNGLHFFFGNVAGSVRTEHISQKNIKVTSVISNIEHCLIFWDPFMADDGDVCPGYFQDHPEHSLNDPKRADVFFPLVLLSENPFSQQYGNGQDQISDHNNTDDNKTKHNLQSFSGAIFCIPNGIWRAKK